MSMVYFVGKKKSVEDGHMTGRNTDRQGVWWVPGAYVNTRSPMKQEDIALIREVVRDARLEWEKEKSTEGKQ